MDFTTILWVVIVGLIALSIFGFIQTSSQSQKKLETSKSLATSDFTPDAVLTKTPLNEGVVVGVAVNKERDSVCLINGENFRYLPSTDLIESEVIVDGKSVTKTSRASQFAGAAIGGVLLGGVGAIIGGLSGKKTTEVEAKGVKLKIVVNDIENPFHVIDFIELTNTGGTPPDQAVSEANEWHELLSTIIKLNERNSAEELDAPIQSGNLSDEIKNLHSLKESGVMTEEEFQQAKAKVLQAHQE